MYTNPVTLNDTPVGAMHMKDPHSETIETFAKRSDRTVIWIAMSFAMGGALMDIGAHVISAMFMKGSGVSMLWGMWIPLCFITIPPIHYLCRHVRTLEKRIDELERQSGERRAA
jgi:hypothetical protein